MAYDTILDDLPRPSQRTAPAGPQLLESAAATDLVALLGHELTAAESTTRRAVDREDAIRDLRSEVLRLAADAGRHDFPVHLAWDHPDTETRGRLRALLLRTYDHEE